MPGYVIGNLFYLFCDQCVNAGAGEYPGFKYRDGSWTEEGGSPLFRYILRVLCGADDLCGICLWGEYAVAGGAGGNEVCGSCLYPLAGSPYSCQPAGWRWRREIGLFFKRVYAAVCECEDLSFGITALTGYVTNYSTALPVLVFVEFVIATIGTVATSAWIGTGLAIQKVYLRHYRLINIILAVTLLECVYNILK